VVSDEFRAFQARLATPARGPAPATLQARRAGMEAAMGSLPLADGIDAVPVDVDGLSLVDCRPRGVPDAPAVLYFHGGGYRLGSARSYRAYGSQLARACSARVVLVDYRLAPEHPFPAAVEDAARAYRWLVPTRPAGARVVVGGDSAGGGLAAALLLRARHEGLPLPAGAFCLSPWADLRNTASSFSRCAGTDSLFSQASADEAAGLYLGPADPSDPLASPVLGDWSGLPPLLIQASAAEVLADDAVHLARAARAAGVEVEVALYEGMPHVWQLHYPAFPEAITAVEQIAAFIARVTSGAGEMPTDRTSTSKGAHP
jgi:monoterpene epsilon-lactone hydrolase